MHGFVNYHFTMSITIDQSGRIVIPKKMRERLNLTEGSLLECELEDDAIRLKLADSHCKLTTKNGILVAQGDAQNSATIDVVKLIKNQRNQRTEITL
jgi:AbrB family looped-hinge helix DNA binding protein